MHHPRPDIQDAFDTVESLFDVRLMVEVAVLVEGVGWQDVATLGGALTFIAGDGPTDECDIYIDGRHAVHLPWPRMRSWSYFEIPDEHFDAGSMIELLFDGWRVRLTPDSPF